MSDERQQRIANAQAMVSSVLNGSLTPERDSARFDEDIVYMSVRIAEQHEPEWLLAQIATANPDDAGVAHVLDCMGPLRERAETLCEQARRNRGV